jgi:hypothetical protein
MKRMKWMRLLLVPVLITVFSSYAGATPNQTLIEAANTEGSLVFYTSMTLAQAQKMLAAFNAKYPFIKTNVDQWTGSPRIRFTRNFNPSR